MLGIFRNNDVIRLPQNLELFLFRNKFIPYIILIAAVICYFLVQGVPAERVAGDAVDELLRNVDSGGCVDEHLQDQLIIFMALAAGKSQIKSGPLTMHTKTAIHVAQLVTKVTNA
ncbi:hypothetical protein QZH41_010618 [Actinostola sp. cb2023]|nr:hypothetical protein QZH41_010618 [Actinostola sp. cb2023]